MFKHADTETWRWSKGPAVRQKNCCICTQRFSQSNTILEEVSWQVDSTGCQSTQRPTENMKSYMLRVVTWAWLHSLSVKHTHTHTLLQHTCIHIQCNDWPPAPSHICWCRRWTGWASPAPPGRQGTTEGWRDRKTWRRKECIIISGRVGGKHLRTSGMN